MTDKELRELESLAVDQDRLFDPAAVIALIAEVRRLNRMVSRACAIIDGCPGFNTMDSSGNGNWFCGNKDCTVEKGQYADCWRKYLQEGEAD